MADEKNAIFLDFIEMQYLLMLCCGYSASSEHLSNCVNFFLNGLLLHLDLVPSYASKSLMQIFLYMLVR